MAAANQMAAAVLSAVRAMIASSFNSAALSIAAMGEKVSALDRRIDALPAAGPGQKGDRGERGEAGPKGQDGKDAVVSIDMLSAALSQQPSLVEAAVSPARIREQVDAFMAANPIAAGRDGRDGRDGAQGEKGRDAIEVDIISGIDASRSYARGTFATHGGCLWLARRDTEAMCGWEVIVHPVAAPAEQKLHADVLESWLASIFDRAGRRQMNRCADLESKGRADAKVAARSDAIDYMEKQLIPLEPHLAAWAGRDIGEMLASASASVLLGTDAAEAAATMMMELKESR